VLSPICWFKFLPRSRRGVFSLLANVLCSVFDQRCNLLRVRDVDRVAGSGDFDFVATGPCGIPAFEIGVDRSVGSGYQHPAWFTSPRRRGDDCFEILSLVHYLRSRHESRLLRWQIGCEVFVKLVSFFFERGSSTGSPRPHKLFARGQKFVSIESGNNGFLGQSRCKRLIHMVI
jgi:hypothetical protein